MLGKDRSFWIVDVDPGLGEAALGFGCWGRSSAVGYFAGVRVRLRKCGWVVFGLVQRDDVAFSLLVGMCPFGMRLVDKVYESELFDLRVLSNVPSLHSSTKNRPKQQV